jgi:sporulation protein YlmC with PRC-barrel domain
MTQNDVVIEETTRLIASNKVEGNAVYNLAGDRLGSIYNFMVDKRSGQVEYAVLSFGGFLGIGNDYYPLPWEVLTYDTDQGGYSVNIDKALLEKAPRYSDTEEPAFDRDYGRQVYGDLSFLTRRPPPASPPGAGYALGF